MKKQTTEKEKRIKILAIVCTAISIILIIIGLVISIFNGNMGVEKDEMTIYLEKMGKEFYEDFYYKQIGQTDKERHEFLEKYKDIGIKVNLDSLSRYKKEDSEKILEEFVNSKTEEACDKTNSMVVIYPKEPYGNEDYRIDAILVCGFEETETK